MAPGFITPANPEDARPGETVQNSFVDAATPDLTVEVIDDRPEEDRKPPVATEVVDDTLSAADAANPETPRKVKEVEARLKWVAHQSRREAEAARVKEQAALAYAEAMKRQVEDLTRDRESAHRAVVATTTANYDARLEQAKTALAVAHQNSDPVAVAEATAAMQQLIAERAHWKVVANTPLPQPQPPQSSYVPQQPVQPPALDKTTMDWLRQNPWMEYDENAREATVQYARRLESQGVTAENPQYWTSINKYTKGFREEWGVPEVNGGQPAAPAAPAAPARQAANGPPLGSATQYNGKVPGWRVENRNGKQVDTVNQDILDVCERLGITPAEWAKSARELHSGRGGK